MLVKTHVRRIYLPQDELQKFGVTEADLIASHYSENFTALMRFQLQRARAMYAQAFAQLPQADRKPQRAGLIMAAIYQATLNEIEHDGCQVLHHESRSRHCASCGSLAALG